MTDNLPTNDTLPPACSLSILAARTDVGFLEHTVPHLVRACAYPFKEHALVIDTAPLGRNFSNRPGIGTMNELIIIADKLKQQGWIDKIHFIDYGIRAKRETGLNYFGRELRETHDFRGYPVHGLLYALDQSPTDLHVHFDSDMLLHQSAGFSWIAHAARLLKHHPELLFAAPLSGPPTLDGRLFQNETPHTLDPGGFYRFEFFTSRKFLVNRARLREVGPISPWWISAKRRALSMITRRSAIWSFEMMASRHMKKHGLHRADLADGRAWTLHTPDHGPRFIAELPRLISRIEAGNFPSGQGGRYDLDLDQWTSHEVLKTN